MAVKACAQIETDAPETYVKNMVTVEEADFDYLDSIWKDFYPTQYIQWADELIPTSGSVNVVWINWRLLPDGTWYDPEFASLSPEEQQQLRDNLAK